MPPVRTLAPALALLLVSSCVLIEGGKLQVDHPERHTESGLVIQDTLSGQGPGAAMGQSIRIDYIAMLMDGTVVDSTYERGHPVELVLGEAHVSGLDEGLVGLAVGGKRRIELPPELAYGADGVPGVIPPNSAMEFLVERLAGD